MDFDTAFGGLQCGKLLTLNFRHGYSKARSRTQHTQKTTKHLIEFASCKTFRMHLTRSPQRRAHLNDAMSNPCVCCKHVHSYLLSFPQISIKQSIRIKNVTFVFPTADLTENAHMNC